MAVKEKILVADDVDISRGVLKVLLGRNYDVLEARNGEEVVKILGSEEGASVACVLLDMLMPVMDGHAVLKWMRARGLLGRIPVIALTAISDADGHIRCYESGAVDLIEKPYDEKILLYKIRFDIDRFRHFRHETPLKDALVAHCAEKLGLQVEEAPAFLASFMKSFDDCAARLAPLEAEPDLAGIREVTHMIRGFARNTGAFDLDDAALLLNAAAKSGDGEVCAAGIRRILALHAAYAAEFV